MSHHLQVIPGTVVEALDHAADHHWAWASYRLILDLDQLTPEGEVELVGTWARRHNPDIVHARLAELGIQPTARPT